MALEGFLLCHQLRGFIRSDQQGCVTRVREDSLVGESVRVLKEDVTLSSSIEIIEMMAVKDTEFWPMSAGDESLLHFPSYGAYVTVLGETLLHVNSVNIQVLHDARALLGQSSIIVMDKLHTGFQSGF